MASSNSSPAPSMRITLIWWIGAAVVMAALVVFVLVNLGRPQRAQTVTPTPEDIAQMHRSMQHNAEVRAREAATPAAAATDKLSLSLPVYLPPGKVRCPEEIVWAVFENGYRRGGTESGARDMVNVFCDPPPGCVRAWFREPARVIGYAFGGQVFAKIETMQMPGWIVFLSDLEN